MPRRLSIRDVFARACVGLAFGLALAFFMATIAMGLSSMARTQALLTTVVERNNVTLVASGEIAADRQSLNVQAQEMATEDFAQVRIHMVVLGALGALATAMGIASALLLPRSITGQMASTCAEIAQIASSPDACRTHRLPMNTSTLASQGIITLMDSIAFQTNILAMSAAVEAARSGEQGQSLALVANEMRNLAGRSAIAAKEIKAFVNASVEPIAQGSSSAAPPR